MSQQLININENSWQADFPILTQGIAYLDSAATAQKPEAVIRQLEGFYKTTNANVHRGIYEWSVAATALYEGARKKVAEFINAKPHEIIFVRNATEAINLVSNSWGGAHVNKGDRILATVMEHHSNLVPWQMLAKKTGAAVDYISITKEGLLERNAASLLIVKKPKLLALTHVSNVLGTVNPVKELVAETHKSSFIVLV